MTKTTSDSLIHSPQIFYLSCSAYSFEDPKLTDISGVLYFTTLATSISKALLQSALDSLLAALQAGDGETPKCLYQLYYQQSRGATATRAEGNVLQLPAPSLSLAFDDATLEPVREAWRVATGPAAEGAETEYMVFADREPVGEYDDED